MKNVIWLVSVCAIGCANQLVGAGDAGGAFAPAEVPTGIYTLTESMVEDTCTPARYVGSGEVAVFALGGSLTVPVLRDPPPGTSVSGFDAFDLGPDKDYVVTSGVLDACPGTTITFTLTLTGANATQLELDRDENWVVASACPVAASSGFPTASCHASRALRYQLVQACPSACVLQGDVTTGYTCSCS